MTQEQVTVLLEIKARMESLERMQAGFNSLHRRLTSFGQALKTGFGINVVQEFIGLLKQIPDVLAQAARSGILFNAQIESAKIGIAAILRQFDPERFKTFDLAIQAAGTLTDQLKEAGRATGNFEGLLEMYQSLAGMAYAANIPLERQVQLTATIARTVAGLGLPREQMVQETRALMTGTLGRGSQIGQALGITSENWKAAKESGRLFEFLTEKMAAFSASAKYAADTFNGQLGKLRGTTKETIADAMLPTFQNLKIALRELNQTVASSEFTNTTSRLGALLAKVALGATAIGRSTLHGLLIGAEAMTDVDFWRWQLTGRIGQRPATTPTSPGGTEPLPAAIPKGPTFSKVEQWENWTKAIDEALKSQFIPLAAAFVKQTRADRGPYGYFRTAAEAAAFSESVTIETKMLEELRGIRAAITRGIRIEDFAL